MDPDTEPVVVVRPIARLTPRNLKALLAESAAQPGVYTAGWLYEEYLALCEWAEAQPISKKAFGMSLAHQGCTPTTKREDGKQHRAWMLPRSRFRFGLEPYLEFSPESRHPTIEHPEGT